MSQPIQVVGIGREAPAAQRHVGSDARGPVGARLRRFMLRPAVPLRWRLVLLVIGSIVPLLAFSLLLQYSAFEKTVSSTGNRTLALAHSMSIAVARELEGCIRGLQVLATAPALHGDRLDLDEVRQRAAALTSQFPGSNVVLLQADGKPLLNTFVPPGSPLPRRANLDATMRVVATGRPAVSGIYRGALNGRLVVAVDVPVKRADGSVAYVLSMHPGLETFGDLIRRAQLPADWVVIVLDQHARIVARQPNPERFVGQPAALGPDDSLTRAPEGFLTDGESLEGVLSMRVYSRTAPYDWVVGIGVPRTELIAPARVEAQQMIVVGLILLAVGVAFALYAATRIGRPIASLHRFASDRDSAPALALAATGLREVDEVAEALRNAEADRRRSREQEQRTRAALQASEEKLRQSQKMEAIGQLTGGLAHDFNNLLLVIMGNLGLLLDSKGADAEITEFAHEAHDAAQRGADLTRSLLAFARRQPLRPQWVDINELVGGIVKLLSRTLGERVQISLDLAADAWPVVVDPAQLQAALANLATNARDAMKDGGRLTITTANRHLDDDDVAGQLEVAAGDYAMIDVTDTGTGMPPDIVAQIFEPFFTTKPRSEGTGLGLSMVFGFIKQSGGHITVDSEPGVGTRIRLFLPRDQREAERDRPALEQAAPRGGGETVLVVEDDEAIRRLVVRQLTELGYRVLEAANADIAIALLDRGERIDLLFSDVLMTGAHDGHDLARIVLERWPTVRVVLTSGFTGAFDRIGESSHRLRLLTKPYRRDDLARVLREALDGGADRC